MMDGFLSDIYVKLRVKWVRTAVRLKGSLFKPTEEEKKVYKWCAMFGIGLGALAVILGTAAPFLADSYSIDTEGMTSDFADVFNTIYGVLLPIVSVLAVVLVAYNILVIMTTKNQRKTDEAFTWIKGVCVTWLCFMLVSVFIDMALDMSGVAGEDTISGVLFDY